jgi:DNA-binding response OmpR family regulator
MRVLIVEDEKKVARALEQGLEGEGYSVAVARTGDEGLARAAAETFDVVLLDVMLPGRSGFDVVRSLRERGCSSPVLLLTARDAVGDRVRGLDSGADDYLVKPFAVAELLARVRALVRRGRSGAALRVEAFGVSVDPVKREATRRGAPLDLTARELELLEHLVRHAGHVVSRDMLARDVWKEDARDAALDNVIDVYVTRLRRKLDSGPAPKLVHTVRGVGFVFREEPA